LAVTLTSALIEGVRSIHCLLLLHRERTGPCSTQAGAARNRGNARGQSASVPPRMQLARHALFARACSALRAERARRRPAVRSCDRRAGRAGARVRGVGEQDRGARAAAQPPAPHRPRRQEPGADRVCDRVGRCACAPLESLVRSRAAACMQYRCLKVADTPGGAWSEHVHQTGPLGWQAWSHD